MKIFINNSEVVFGMSEPILATKLRNGGISNHGNGDKVATCFIRCSDFVGQKIQVYTDKPQAEREGEPFKYYYEMIFSSDESLIGTAPNVAGTNTPGKVKEVLSETAWGTLQTVPANAVCLALCICEVAKPAEGAKVYNTLRITNFDYKLGFRIVE